MKDIELPPLPEPTALGMDFDKGWDGVRAYGYTEEDMASYARAAVEADRAQRVPHPVYLSARALIDAARRDWPSSSVHRARVLDDANALESALLASTPAPAQQEPAKAVAYLDIGIGANVDIGSELSPEDLAALPRGRHMLVIAGTYGIDGYKPVAHQEPPQPVERKPMTDEVVRLAGVVLNEMPHPVTNWQSAAKKVCEAIRAAIKEQT